MKEIIKNNILIKGEYSGNVLFIPEGVETLEQHAFPWKDFITLKNEVYLCCSVGVWFSLPNGSCAYFSGSSKKKNLYQIFCWYHDSSDHHTREEVFASPKFLEYFRTEKIKLANSLYRSVKQLVQIFSKQYTNFQKFPDFCFYQGKNGDFYMEAEKMDASAYGLELEQGCRKFLEKHLDTVMTHWMQQWMFEKNTVLIQNICNAGLIPEKYIDQLIQDSIVFAHETGNYEIQILLAEYKHQHFPDSNPADKLRLE